MDSDLKSAPDNAGSKAAFHKPSNDPSNRKYRRRSPVNGSSSSDGEPVHEHNSTPTYKKDDIRDKDRDHKRSHYSRDITSTRNTDRRSYNYNDRRHDDYKRRDKYTDEDQKNFHKSSPRSRGNSGSYNDHSRREFEQNRSRDGDRDRDRSDGSGHRSRDKYKRDDAIRDEKRSGNYYKNNSWRDSAEHDEPKYSKFEKGKSYDQETREIKDRHIKEPRDMVDDRSVLSAKKSKFSMDKDTEYSKDALKHVTVPTEVESSNSKEGEEVVNREQEFVKDSDIDAAKVAAMKAAELVNKNLVGTGLMSTDQKKKLLWGSKKSTPTEEVAHRWDTSMFSDRERQEKFNKLMGVKGEVKVEKKADAEKQNELQMDLEKQYTAGLRRRDGRTVGLGL